MCGITGVVNASGTTAADVQAMVDSIRYRGRNDEGLEVLGRAIVGHARLAVIDPENGKQPMTNEDGTLWVVFNGGIYNYVELREELVQKGYRFRTNCDTEVLLHLWREYGEAMLPKLIGMFAFFVWDTKEQRGILARDRQGIKPCFVAEYRGGIAFASEIKAILTLPGMKREMNADAVKDVFTFNYCPPPQTCYKGVRHLEPGSYLLFDGGKAPQQKRYWHWPLAEEKRTPSFEEFEALVNDSVRIQMRFDIAGGMYLSGGVDSSAVAAHIRKVWTQPRLTAFGLNFPNQEYSEFRYSEQVAKLLDIDLIEARITPDMIPGIADKVSYHAEQPHGDFSFFLFYLLAQTAVKNEKYLLFTGDGPDETLAGQQFHRQPPDGFSLRDYFGAICYMEESQRKQLLNPDFERSTPEPFARLQQMLAPYANLSPVDKIVAYEAMYLLPGNNLVKGDRMGGAWSTENRSPFLDHRISELFVRLPDNQKFCDGYSKYYFKKYAATKLPEDLIFKKKSMPTLPIGEWIKTTLHDWAHATLSRHDGSVFNTKLALATLADHTADKANHTRALRTLLMTQLWMENGLKRSAASHALSA